MCSYIKSSCKSTFVDTFLFSVFSVIPFGVGKRACPGQDFAKSRIFICITTLLQRMRFVPPEGEPLPSADPRSYGKQYPMSEPVYSCVVMPREDAII